MQQHPACRFERSSVVLPIAGVKQRPSAGTVPRTRSSSAALAGAALGIDQRTELVETVRCEQSGGDELPKTGFYLSLQLARASHDISEKRSAALPQEL